MDIEKDLPVIEIKISDDGEFTDVALLVAKEDFRRDVKKLRTKYSLNRQYPLKDHLSVYREFEYKLASNKDLEDKFHKDIEVIRLRYRKPTHFLKAIKKAIVVGVIGDGDYAKAYLETENIYLPDSDGNIEDTKYSIVIFPGTREGDVKKVFSDFNKQVTLHFGKNKRKENLLKDSDTKAYFDSGYWYDPTLNRSQDSRENIQEVYKWHTSGLKPIEIALVENDLSYEEYKRLKKQYDNIGETDNPDQRYYLYSRLTTSAERIKKHLQRFRGLLKTS